MLRLLLHRTRTMFTPSWKFEAGMVTCSGSVARLKEASSISGLGVHGDSDDGIKDKLIYAYSIICTMLFQQAGNTLSDEKSPLE